MPKTDRDELVDLVFSQDGLLSKHLGDFEERAVQKEMASTLYQAYEENKIALIEAGTGTGKSFAYLVPALFWSLKFQEKTIISTHTIALQEQLIKKDIPFLLSVLDIDVKAVLVKGMENYLCLKKYDSFRDQNQVFDKRAEQLDNWVLRTEDGSRSSFPYQMGDTDWSQLKAERESCTHNKCPFFKECFFFKARKKVNAAQLLVVNHHLLFSDKYAKSKIDGEEDERTTLPPAERVIIDEAHHIEETISQIFASKVDQVAVYHLLTRVHNDRGQAAAFVTAVGTKLLTTAKPLSAQEVAALTLQLDLEVPEKKLHVLQTLKEAFLALDRFCMSSFQNSEIAEQKWRLTEELIKIPLWDAEIKPAFTAFSNALKALIIELEIVSSKIAKISGDEYQVDLFECTAIIKRLRELEEALALFFSQDKKTDLVQWIEKRLIGAQIHYVLNNRYLDVAPLLEKYLFNAHSSSILCSATLTTGGNFNFLKSRLGISEKEELLEGSYPSPFDYASRAIFAVPSDICDPSDPRFNEEASKAIEEAVKVSNGGAFILFTSYTMLAECYATSSAILERQGFTLFRQGDRPRRLLLEEFKEAKKPVLFGTDSFWEGVDVAGDALKLVVIVKIPFKVPSDPLVQAYSERLVSEGKDPFFHYSIPHAVVKFKQGFGRLIRKKEDRGCVLCLDKRIFTKAYGKQFLLSLPPVKLCYEPKKKLYQEIKELYKRTEVTV